MKNFLEFEKFGKFEYDDLIEQIQKKFRLGIKNPFESFKGQVSHPVNPEAAEAISDPEYLKNYFLEKGYINIPAKSIVNKDGSTILTTAGVQILDKAIFAEEDVPKEKMFVVQPVIRSQFLDCISEGTSTSFINISTEKVNPTIEEHFQSLEDWLSFLTQLGFSNKQLALSLRTTQPKWGDKKYHNKVIDVYYDNLQIGDATLNMDIPQKTREPLRISDIGFGLERIQWLLRGGSYFEIEDKELFKKYNNNKLLDCAKGMTLLTGSGVLPSNNNEGYRLRQYSKRFIDASLPFNHELDNLFNYFYQFWSGIAKFSVNINEMRNIITKENERNLNREIISRLQAKHDDVDIDINQPTKDLLKALRGTSVDQEFLMSIIKKMYG